MKNTYNRNPNGLMLDIFDLTKKIERDRKKLSRMKKLHKSMTDDLFQQRHWPDGSRI